MILLTKSSVPIIGQVASIMGWIMDGIYRVLDLVGIQNLGLCIIIFSIIIYALMTPLQVKQQKFSKLSSVMQPELQKIQKKYKDKKDQASVQKMQEETQLVYQKYGVSPTGQLCAAVDPVSCPDGIMAGYLQNSWLCWQCKECFHRPC